LQIQNQNISQQIKTKASELGFFACGITSAEDLISEQKHLKIWIEKGFNAEMKYMERNFEKRISPSKLHIGTKSVIVVLQNYFVELENSEFKVSKYASGIDYHAIIRNKLHELLEFIKSINPVANGRVFVDSAPVLERTLAKNAGLGFIGKNNCLITKNQGSFFFIGEIFLNLDLDFDKAIEKDYCGTCTNCIDACPTNALNIRSLDANKCISYQTIENKNEIPNLLKGKTQNWIFGCDICQDVCPWNKKSILTTEKEILKNLEILNSKTDFWKNLTKTDFKKYFKNTALERAGFEKLKGNIEF
jgi:epoxyqueuosine reductase